MHIPSNWDISHPRESDAGTNTWGPKNKHIMAEVEKNIELLRKALREIQGLKEALMDILVSHHHLLHHQKKIEYRVRALPLASAKLGGGAPVSYHPYYLSPLLILVRSIVIF